LFERALAACGKGFKSCLLWDKYIEFEKAKKKFEHVGALYWRILHIPNEKLHDYYGRFKLFMEAKGRKMEHYGASLPPHPEKAGLNIDPADPCKLYPDFDTKAEMHYSALCEEKRELRLKEIIATYENTLKEYNKRRIFEQNIKRTFFHAKSLDEAQLEVWRKYLEFEENEGSYEKIVLLYERCVVPLCFYHEFWERYAMFMFMTHGEEAARKIFQRGIGKFMKNRPDLYLAQGSFEESLGNVEAAKGFYTQVYENIAPGLFDGIFRHLNLERRLGNFEKVEELFQFAFQQAYSSGQETLVMFVSSKYAQFQLYVKNDTQKMIEIYEKALSEISSKKSLYFAYIKALAQVQDKNKRLELTRKTYEKAISKESEVIFIYEAS
jgi:pre-mRNA-processing factor 39